MNRLEFGLSLVLVAFVLSFVSCAGNSSQDVSQQKEKAEKIELQVKEAPHAVHVYFFDDFPVDLGNLMIDELKKVYPTVKFENRIPLPSSAYYAPRNRYLAPKLLDTMMSLQPNKDKVLGFTTKDISLKYKNYENWGVMGLSYLNKRACVISTFRLKSPDKLKEHFTKLMLHEMGHVEGLAHCEKIKTCIMRDAEGKNHFSELNNFCPSCKAYLKGKGWVLSKDGNF